MTEQFEQYLRSIREVIANLDVSVAEYAILNHIHFGCWRLPESLAKFAGGPDYALNQNVTAQEASNAVKSCFKRGLVRVVSKIDVKRIQFDLSQEGIIGPVYGLPFIGCVDFTAAGAALWHLIMKLRTDSQPQELRRGYAYCDTVELRTRYYFASYSAARRYRVRLRDQIEFAEMTSMTAVEELRMAWWAPIIQGWTFEATEAFHWQGRFGGASGGASLLDWDSQLACVNRRRFRQECRRFKIDPGVLCVLLSVAKWGAHFANDVCRFSMVSAVKVFGLCNANERMKKAIHHCLQQGLLLRLNEKEVLRIQQDGNTLCAPLVQRGDDPQTLELSELGVAMLLEYCPTILGDGWLDGWIVQREEFRREHRYVQDSRDIDSIYDDYRKQTQERATICSINEIGPWCVYWWERFPKGFRVEVEVRNDRFTAQGVRML